MDQFRLLIESFRAAFADRKISFAEALMLSQMFIQSLVLAVENLPLTGPEKKAKALEELGRFIDTVITPMDIPSVPNIIEGAVDAGVKAALLLLADKAINLAVEGFNKLGWPKGN